MPTAIKKELVFGLLILLLLVLFILNMTKKEGNTGSKFADLLGDGGLLIIESSTRNAVDSQITYTLPTSITIGGSVASYYKWPLLYLIDVGSIASPPTIAALNASNYYKKPPPKALLNSDYVANGGGAAGTTGYYALTTTPSDGTFFPNLINLTNLYGSTPTNNLQAPATGSFTVTDNTVGASASGSWILPGLKDVINAPLIPGRAYILGVSAQLTAAYVNLYGTSKYVAADPINKRFGNFTYVQVSYSLNGLLIAAPGAPTGAAASTLTLTI